jgi:cytochrome c556
MQTRQPTIVLLAMLFAAVGSSPTLLFAHSGAKGIVMERMAVMKSIGKSMKSMSRMARGKSPMDFATIETGAGALARHGGQIPALFPKGSGRGVSEASPKIWDDPGGFKLSANGMVAAARTLESAANVKDAVAVKISFRALGRTCGGCHKQFRIKKKKK